MCRVGLDAVRVARAGDYMYQDMPWGRLVWQASGAIGNADFLTVGRCILDPGQQNNRHYHPNCEEVLQVLSGRILHSWGENEVVMEEGDTIGIPPRVVHNARNLSTESEAILAICFSTPDRRVVDVTEIAGVPVGPESGS